MSSSSHTTEVEQMNEWRKCHNDKEKILFVIESLGCGGAEKSLISLLSSLDKERYDLSIWMMYPKGAFLSFLPNDVNVIKQPKYNVFESMLLYLSSILYSVIWRLNKW